MFSLVLLHIALFIFLIYILLSIYVKLTCGWCKSQTCLVNKTVIVTGANTGIGYEAALDFAKRGARVILACRNKNKAEEARLKIVDATGNENIVVKTIDMASFDSVRAFAKEINETEDRLDILVNNAGALGLGDRRSKDGHLLMMQVNYFSSFLLTNLLIILLKKSAPSRIVNVASLAAMTAITFDLNNFNQFHTNQTDYSNTKLCNVLFTQELAKKLRGTGVTTYSLHPGVVRTDIFHNLRGLLKVGYSIMVNFTAKNVEEGAQTIIYCAVAKGIEEYSGEHFSDCRRIKPYRTARDAGLAKKLWEKTEEMVNLKRDEIQL